MSHQDADGDQTAPEAAPAGTGRGADVHSRGRGCGRGPVVAGKGIIVNVHRIVKSPPKPRHEGKASPRGARATETERLPESMLTPHKGRALVGQLPPP